MKVLHITPAYHPATYYGGPLLSVHRLCTHLARAGCEVRVLTTNADGPGRRSEVPTDRELELEPGLRVRYCPTALGSPVAPSLLARLPTMVHQAEVVHLTGVYSYPVIPALAACRLLGRPLVWSPRGSLQRWEGSRRPQLKAAWERACRLALPARGLLHVTSRAEAAESGPRMPGLDVAVIANGVDLAPVPSRSPRGRALRLLFLGRLDPKKGLENLLEACQQLERGTVPWQLAIAGDGEPSYARSLRARAQKLELEPHLRWLGHVTGEAKTAALADADLLVAPSHTENFAMVVVEALAAGLPVIASRGTPWAELETHGCGLWTDNRPASLAQAIARSSDMPLEEMGQRGRAWVEREFAWPEIAQKMRQAYQGLVASA